MSTKIQVEWRRTKVLELLSKGDSQSDIAKTLQVDLSIISRDVFFLRQQVQWRRDKVQELCSKGYSQREISQILQVGFS